ncbi:relaxasome subunit MobC [Bacillus sp. OV166]|nr:relaxasome subunit MobC [Bacillus sp. OV166]
MINMTNEELHKLEDKIKVLEQKKKALEYKISNEDRRARTRRLIQKGALLEKYLENENVSLKDTEDLLKILAEFKNKNKEYIDRQIQNMQEDREAH